MLSEEIKSEAEQTKLFKAQNDQDEAIKKEIESQSLFSDKLPISSLEVEYRTEESSEFLKKAKDLASKFTHIRRVRGDGNCMYRALAFSLLESLIGDSDALKEFLELVSTWKERLFQQGFPDMTTEDFCDTFVDVVKSVISMKSADELLRKFNEEGLDGYIVVFMRLVTSGFLREQSERFQGFIEGQRTVKEYCEADVDPMYKECDHLCITALTEGLKVPVRIEYMDRTQAPAGGYHHDFMQDGDKVPKLHFLYRPGHYDILYT